MAKRKSIKGQTITYKTLHRKLKIEQQNPTKNLRLDLLYQYNTIKTYIVAEWVECHTTVGTEKS